MTSHPDRDEAWTDHATGLLDSSYRAVTFLETGRRTRDVESMTARQLDGLLKELIARSHAVSGSMPSKPNALP